MSMKKLAIVAPLFPLLLVGCGGNVDKEITSNYTEIIESKADEPFVKTNSKMLGVSFVDVSISCIKEVLPKYDEKAKEVISEAISKDLSGDDLEPEEVANYSTWENSIMQCVNDYALEKKNSQ